VTTRSVRVPNVLGLHARAAARFVRLAATFAAHVKVAHNGRVIDGKSIMGLLLLAAARGAEITITADGSDEQGAVEALCGLIARGFDEEGACPS
jgi:phosphocarrier protein HPr